MSVLFMATALREELSRREMRQLRRRNKRAARHLRRAIRAFVSLGYETDTSDLRDYLSEALELQAALGKALAYRSGPVAYLPGEPDEDY